MLLSPATTGYDVVTAQVVRRHQHPIGAGEGVTTTLVSDRHRRVAATFDPLPARPFSKLLPMRLALSAVTLAVVVVLITSDVGIQGIARDLQAFRLSRRERQLRRVFMGQSVFPLFHRQPPSGTPLTSKVGDPVFVDAVSGRATTSPPPPFTSIALSCVTAVPTRSSVWCQTNATRFVRYSLDPSSTSDSEAAADGAVVVRSGNEGSAMLLDATASADGQLEVAIVTSVGDGGLLGVDVIVCAAATGTSCGTAAKVTLLGGTDDDDQGTSSTVERSRVAVVLDGDTLYIAAVVGVRGAAGHSSIRLLVVRTSLVGGVLGTSRVGVVGIDEGVFGRPHLGVAVAGGAVSGTVLQHPAASPRSVAASFANRTTRLVSWSWSAFASGGIDVAVGTPLDCMLNTSIDDAIPFHAPLSKVIPSSSTNGTHPPSSAIAVIDASGTRVCFPLDSVFGGNAPAQTHARRLGLSPRRQTSSSPSFVADGLVDLAAGSGVADNTPRVVVTARVNDAGAVAIDVVALDLEENSTAAVRVAELSGLLAGSTAVRLAVIRQTVVVVVRSGDVQLVPIAKWSVVGTLRTPLPVVPDEATMVASDVFVPWGNARRQELI